MRTQLTEVDILDFDWLLTALSFGHFIHLHFSDKLLAALSQKYESMEEHEQCDEAREHLKGPNKVNQEGKRVNLVLLC